MSKTTIITLSIIGLILVGGVYMAMRGNHKQAITQATKEDIILLYVERGEVSYKSPTSSSFVVAQTSPIEIANQTTVKTGNGRATVLLPSNSTIDVAENTEIAVSYTASSTSIFQSLGSTYHRVETLLSGETYTVQTPGTLAAVRGTKFGVKFDKKKSQTQVSVTEHIVKVSKVKHGFISGTTTITSDTEEFDVTEGKTAKVQESPSTTSGGVSPGKGGAISLTNTDDDKELKTWIEENKAKDVLLKEQEKGETKETYESKRELFKQIIEKRNEKKSDDIKQDDTTSIKTDTKTDVKADVKTDTTQPKTVDTRVNTDTTTNSNTPTGKLDEEQFFNQFNDLFVKYFYVEGDNATCALKVTPAEKVKLVVDFATANGFEIDPAPILKYAQAIASYCSGGRDTSALRDIENQFDDAFPFKQSI